MTAGLIDAENLARLARVDPKLLYPPKHRGEESQAHLARGKNARRRAVVAVARKVSVLLHGLWVSAEVYEPLRNTHRFGGQAA